MYSGTITRYGAGSLSSVGVTLTSRGQRLYRADVQESVGTTTSTVNGDGAAVLNSSGAQTLPFYTALGLRPMAFPFYSGLLSFSDDTFTLQYQGTETVVGQSSYRVKLTQQLSAADPSSPLRALATQLTVWVSTTSNLPIQIEYIRLSLDNPTASRPITRTYSDYRTVSGLAIPFHQEEFANGKQLSSLQLSRVSLNTGVALSQFALPAPQN